LPPRCYLQAMSIIYAGMEVPCSLLKKIWPVINNYFSQQAHLPYVGHVGLWMLTFVVAPLMIILYFSFLRAGSFGQVLPGFTLENYIFVFKGAHGLILLRSFYYAFLTNLICILLGYPLAYWIVYYGGRWKTLFIFLIIIPSWTSYLIRLYALRTLIGHTGLINTALINIGLINAPVEFLYTQPAVILGLVYSWLPFMVLPIYASLVGLDQSLLEAADDLGARPVEKFFTVTLPLTKGGVFAGTILVFIPAFGEWLVPMLMGGAKVMMAGSLVEHYFITTGNIPAGAAMAALITATVLLVIYLSVKLGGKEVLERIT
jgi:spermidine/putrescine transport system permease protein